MLSLLGNRRKRFRNTPESFLTYSSGAAGDFFGQSVSLSKDSNTLAVGVPRRDVGANTNQGSCTIFIRNGSTWSEQAFLTYSGGAAEDFFGYSVSLSNDGNTLAVGAYLDNVGANTDQGSCTIFTRSGSIWSEQAYLTYSSGAASDGFGWRVSLSNDGNTLAVSALYDDVGANSNQGSCIIFTRSGSTWSEQAYLTYSGGAANDAFGQSVSLSGDGNTLAVGANTDTVGANSNQGSCTIFTRTGSTWSQQAYLTYSAGTTFEFFGESVSLSNDGNTLAVGAYRRNVGANNYQGACIIFTRSGTTWSEQAFLTYSGGAAVDFFGRSVSLSSDGNTLAVGADNAIIGGNNFQGYCVVFTRRGSTWSEQKYLKYSNGAASDLFGTSISLSGNGKILAVGVIGDNVGANADQGSVIVFYRR